MGEEVLGEGAGRIEEEEVREEGRVLERWEKKVRNDVRGSGTVEVEGAGSEERVVGSGVSSIAGSKRLGVDEVEGAAVESQEKGVFRERKV